MVYHFRNKWSVEKGLRRIAGDQIDKAIQEVDNHELGHHETVHQVRKRCKKVRGLIRLVRGSFADYSRENAFFRDAARSLSFVRDTQSVIECLDALALHFRDQVDSDQFTAVRERLALRQRRVMEDQAGLEKKLDVFRAKMRGARYRVLSWELREKRFAAMEGGLRRTYGRARSALTKAYQNPGAETFHEWRKRAKYHWYHMRLLRCAWTEMMAVRIEAADELADLLGVQHDLSVLRNTLVGEPDAWDAATDVRALVLLIDRRWEELKADVRPLGERLFAEKPKRWAKRLEKYWHLWDE
jgi:CHAD domain-containing protein